MRVYVLNSALPRSPLGRFAAGVVVLLVLTGLVLVVLPLAGLALLLALAGVLTLAVARGLWRMIGQPEARAGVAAPVARPRYARRAQDVIDVEILSSRRAPD